MTDLTSENSEGKIQCQIDKAWVHSIGLHIKEFHTDDWSTERYKAEFPGAPLLSNYAQKAVEDMRKKKDAAAAAPAAAPPCNVKSMRELFDMGEAPAAKNSRGGEIMLTCFDYAAEPEMLSLVPDIDKNYVFSIDLLKTAIIGFEKNIPVYLWGLHGTGKTTLLEQTSARTGRAFMRVQHTVNMEETDLLGNYIVRNGETRFELGPLALAMTKGMVYCADEYDFAMPSVLSVYQPVLEGKSLVIKNAPLDCRVIRPHKDFRFCATGNTNGGGDETGLYQGTQMQNAANYSRFGIVEEVPYMEEPLEIAVLQGQTGLQKDAAKKFVEFARHVRESFRSGKIGATISPRELITSARLSLLKGSQHREGLRLGFINRLSRVDKVTINEFAQRVFGS